MSDRRRWTTEEEEFLKENFHKYPTHELAIMLNRVPNAIRDKSNRLGFFRKDSSIPREKDGLHYCPDCKTYKERTEFYKSSSSKTGLHNYCKICSSTRGRKNFHLQKVNEDKKRKQQFIDERKDQLFTCNFCKEELPISAYAVYKSSKSEGKFERRNRCHECHKKSCLEHTLKKERGNEYAKFKG
jgi:hypothetical protein